MYHHLRLSSGVTHQIYGLPVRFKLGIQLRPIVSFISSLMYNLSKFLVKILSPLVGNSEHHVRNSADFVPFDAKSLFTNVLVELAIKVASGCLQDDNTFEARTSLSADKIMSSTFLSFQGSCYKQVFGTAMASPVSVVMANKIMECVEETALKSYVCVSGRDMLMMFVLQFPMMKSNVSYST